MSLFYERYPMSKEPNEEILTPVILRRAQIGEMYWSASFDAIPDHIGYKDLVVGYTLKMHERAEDGWGLVLSGPWGTGKTALGSLILMEGLKRRGRCLSISCITMIDQLWAKRPVYLLNGAPLREGLENVSFLFLDDFELFESGAKNSLVESIIRARYIRNLPTIISTNHTWDRLLDGTYLNSMLPDRWWSVSVKGIDWRKRR